MATRTYISMLDLYTFVSEDGTKVHKYSFNKTNEKHKFFKFIFGIKLYMFRAVSLSIIRSLALYIQQ